jgi:hypothetical protein
MERKVKMLPPIMLNFIKLDLQVDSTISIWDLTREESEEYEESIKQEFIKY